MDRRKRKEPSKADPHAMRVLVQRCKDLAFEPGLTPERYGLLANALQDAADIARRFAATAG